VKVTLIGGMERLEQHYRREARVAGHELKIFFKYETDLSAKIGATDAVVVFTGKVSHSARNLAVDTAKTLGIPLVQSHSSGVTSLRLCLGALSPSDPRESGPTRSPGPLVPGSPRCAAVDRRSRRRRAGSLCPWPDVRPQG